MQRGGKFMQAKFSVENPFRCPLCNWTTTKVQAIPQHLRWHHSGKKHCPKCYDILDKAEMPAHLERHKSEKVLCPYCGELFAKGSIGGHISAVHTNNGMFSVEARKRAMNTRRQNKAYRCYLSQRIKKKNPLSKKGPRDKMTNTIRQMVANGELVPYGNLGIYGNGGIPTKAEEYILTRYQNAHYQHVVAPSDGIRPYHYKIDFAFPSRKIGLEIDGPSHANRQDADRKKDARLNTLGWTIIRVKNEEVLSGKSESVLLEFGITRDGYMT